MYQLQLVLNPATTAMTWRVTCQMYKRKRKFPLQTHTHTHTSSDPQLTITKLIILPFIWFFGCIACIAEMWPMATGVTCSVVCVLVTLTYCAKTAESINTLLGRAYSRWTKEPCIRCGREPPWEEVILGLATPM